MFDLKTRVIVVDDMLPIRKSVVRVLKDIGFTDIVEASDGNLAWNQLTMGTRAPGLIISDWMMPNCTGIELLKKVRGDFKFFDLPFLLVTAEAEQDQIIEAIKAGVSSYIVKPFDPAVLAERIEAMHAAILAKQSPP